MSDGISLAIIGSRAFANARLVAETLDPLIPALKEVVSGGASGADKLGEQWANKRGIPTTIYYPDHKKYRHAYHHRNRLIAERCDELIAFWDGRSSGTRYTMNYAKRIGKPVRVVRF